MCPVCSPGSLDHLDKVALVFSVIDENSLLLSGRILKRSEYFVRFEHKLPMRYLGIQKVLF